MPNNAEAQVPTIETVDFRSESTEIARTPARSLMQVAEIAETHFPESREVYLGLLGLLYRERPAEFMPPNSQHCEHDMAEWFLKRRQAYRPSWGGLQ